MPLRSVDNFVLVVGKSFSEAMPLIRCGIALKHVGFIRPLFIVVLDRMKLWSQTLILAFFGLIT